LLLSKFSFTVNNLIINLSPSILEVYHIWNLLSFMNLDIHLPL
jgi:hypothetical protein